ncbi:MAG: precorrin-6A/cobalt-precorrin-6A reductase [Clostridia bacterium]|nr:precorrin-6A/cobalt-precorrin-6A reductase [Clostridia bacterium]
MTKNSGQEGGVNEKIKAAKEKGIEVLMLNRPKIAYPNVFNDMDQLIDALKERC